MTARLLVTTSLAGTYQRLGCSSRACSIAIATFLRFTTLGCTSSEVSPACPRVGKVLAALAQPGAQTFQSMTSSFAHDDIRALTPTIMRSWAPIGGRAAARTCYSFPAVTNRCTSRISSNQQVSENLCQFTYGSHSSHHRPRQCQDYACKLAREKTYCTTRSSGTSALKPIPKGFLASLKH